MGEEVVEIEMEKFTKRRLATAPHQGWLQARRQSQPARHALGVL